MKRMMAGFFLVLGALVALPVAAQSLTMTITNLTPGSYFTPLLVAAHGNGTRIFEVGTAASASLQAMAEGGDLTGLVSDLQAAGADVAQDPAGGLLGPGAATTLTLSNATGNDVLSLVAMILPTNDGFVGLDSLKIPASAGTYHYYMNAYDAGTEANDEIVNGAGAPGMAGIPADPGGSNGSGASGVTTVEANSKIHVHRGILGDTDAAGGASDLDSRVHRWLNPVAKITITVN